MCHDVSRFWAQDWRRQKTDVSVGPCNLVLVTHSSRAPNSESCGPTVVRVGVLVHDYVLLLCILRVMLITNTTG